MQVSIGNCADKASHILTEKEAPVKISIYFINRPKKEKMKRKLARALEGALKDVPSSCTVRVAKWGGGGGGFGALEPTNFCRGARSPKPLSNWSPNKNPVFG